MFSEKSNYQGRDGLGDFMIETDQPVYIHRNLHTPKGTIKYSARSRGGSVPAGRVFHHSDEFVVEQPDFKVQQAGYWKFHDHGIRTVHAGIAGILRQWRDIAWPDYEEVMRDPAWSVMSYDPRIANYFFRIHRDDYGNASPLPLWRNSGIGFAMIGRWGNLQGLPARISENRSLILVHH